MTHPTISFAANEAWSVTTVLNWNGDVEAANCYCGSSIGAGDSAIRIKTIGSNFIVVTNSSENSATGIKSTSGYIGKNVVVTLTAQGNGSISSYINGTFSESLSLQSNIVLSTIFVGRGSLYYRGSIHAHIIRSQALTPAQVAAEANFLRTLYPEIPSVTIGSQTWATSNCDQVATPMGNLMQNVTLNTNTGKITNGGFDSDTVWSKETGWTISGGVAVATNIIETTNPKYIYQSITNKAVGKWYKITFTVSSISSGSFKSCLNSTPNAYGIARTSIGTYTDYIQCISTTSGNVSIAATNGTNGTIDNVSVQEVGWSDATNLYNYVYAATSGTDEQKTYAAVKAAAMWRFTSNDVALGSVYGKKYNKYALKLLAMDIAYYNTANPTTPLLWDVPTQSQLTTLAAIGGNAAKKDGINYWNTANGTNSSGLTALGGGYIASNGTTTNLKSSEYIGCKDADIAREIKDGDDTFNEVAIAEQGVSIRLIKN
jgi:hypothetical protein